MALEHLKTTCCFLGNFPGRCAIDLHYRYYICFDFASAGLAHMDSTRNLTMFGKTSCKDPQLREFAAGSKNDPRFREDCLLACD